MRHRSHPTPSLSGPRVIGVLLVVIATGAAVAGLAHAAVTSEVITITVE